MYIVPPSVLHIRYRGQQRQNLGTLGDERAKTEHAQDHMGMAGTTKTNSMEGMETSDHGAVRTGGQHATTPRGLVRRTSHKSGMVSGHEGTGILASNKRQMNTAPSTEHRTTALLRSKQGGSRNTHTCTHACHHSDPTASVYRDQQTDTYTHTTHNTDHTTGPVCVGHRRSVPHPAKTCTASGGEFQTPRQWDVTKEVDLIIATDGSILFGVGYHNWILATETEDIPLAGGGLDNGPGKCMTSYRSELGGIIAGPAVIGTLLRSGLINARNIAFICDNSAAILASKRELTQSILHKTEGDHDLIATMKYLHHNWCNNTEVAYAWVKGHAYRGNQEPNRDERLNIEADALCDLIREEARGLRGARPSCPHWDLEVCSLFIKGDKVTSKMKTQMAGQLHDKDKRKYLIE
jgi:hypothetical protein